MICRSLHNLAARQTGFTLIELVAAMVIIATLGVLLVPRFGHNEATVPAQADQLGRALRHAQTLAMNQGRGLTMDVQSATSYAITDGATPAAIRDPGGEQQFYSLRNGVTVTGTDIAFDSLGRPVNGGTLITASQSWTLSAGANSATVSIEPVTGFVTVAP
jgi:prepilin-type N-terminal cleavage/methylation domain-containing protein